MTHRKLVSYTIFKDVSQDVRIYALGAIHNAVQIPTIYPEYTGIFYLQDGLYELGNILGDLGATIYYCQKEDLYIPLLWRFRPLFELEFDICLFRDSDSRLSFREKNLVSKFERSNLSHHSIIDNVLHKRPLMAGMWGTKNVDPKIFDDLKQSHLKYKHHGKFMDEVSLERELWPKIKNDTLIHNSNIDSDFPPSNRYIGEKKCNISAIVNHKDVSQFITNKLIIELDELEPC